VKTSANDPQAGAPKNGREERQRGSAEARKCGSRKPVVSKEYAVSSSCLLRSAYCLLFTAYCLLLTVVIACPSAVFAERPTPDAERAPNAPSPFDGIKATYSQITTLEAGFHQKLFIASMKKEREFDGEFFYKRQKGFLWRYKTPKMKVFLYDGRHIWQDEEGKDLVLKERIDREKTRGTFLDLIEDIAKLDELFTLKEHKVSGGMEVMELKPKKDGTVTMAKVWIDAEKRVRKIEITEFTGNVNTVEFSSIRVNRPIDDGKFMYRPAKGKEIMER
jgi:outer membrane lipoprotein-sorting protein